MTDIQLPAVGTAPASVFVGADLCSLAGFTLPDGHFPPLFEQDLRNFRHVLGLPAYLSGYQRELDFRGIRNPRWRVLAKEYIAVLMAPDHPAVKILPQANRTALALQTCQGRLQYVTDWLNWLTEQGVTRLDQVTERHCQSYSQLRKTRFDTKKNVLVEQKTGHALALTAVIGLAQYGELFSTDRYLPTLRPFGGRSPAKVSGRNNAGENKTQPVPGDILQPLLNAALFFTQSLGPRILAERERVNRLQSPAPHRKPQENRNKAIERLHQVLKHHRTHRIPLFLGPPSSPGRKRLGMRGPEDPLRVVSLKDIARQAGYRTFDARWLPAIRPDLEATLADVGVQEPYGRGADLVDRADGQGPVPWTEPISAVALRDAVYFTRTATIIVIAATSGMRTSELCELAVGCCLPPAEQAPGLFRYRLASNVIKGKPLGGEDDLWIISREAYDAAQLAERLLGPKASEVTCCSTPSP
ncbi:hypothetical protein ACWD48_30510 [Streptomyces sp. NPDC002519]